MAVRGIGEAASSLGMDAKDKSSKYATCEKQIAHESIEIAWNYTEKILALGFFYQKSLSL